MEELYNPDIRTEVEIILKKYLQNSEKQQLFYTWYSLLEEVLMNPEVQKRRFMEHHRNLSVFKHCVIDSFAVYLRAIKKNCLDIEITNAAIAGMLHDFYTLAYRKTDSLLLLGSPYYDNFYPNPKRYKSFEKHGFTHPKAALENSVKYFPNLMNERIEDAILWHMFPLTNPPWRYPTYIEGKMLTWVDKTASFNALSIKEIPVLLGLKRNQS